MTSGLLPSSDQTRTARNGAEALIQLLVEQHVENIFLNPGTDTAPIQEAIVALRCQGVAVPRIRLCPDERVALSAAHGLWLATGSVQVVMVHVDVGTQSLGAALHNAQRSHAGVVIIAGRSPRTFNGELAGGRSIVAQWLQDQPDQTGVVRGFVKWADEITFEETFATLLPRAFQVAGARPSGPVYLTIAREVLMAPVAGVRVRPASRHRPPITPAADGSAIATVAAWLADAQKPVMVTGRVGRNRAAVDTLAELCDLIGLPVVDGREYLNLPAGHPCNLRSGLRATEAIQSADVVLVIDVEVPWVPLVCSPPEHARIVQIDLDPVKSTISNWGFPVDLPIQADPAKALGQLTAALRAITTREREERWAQRLNGLGVQAARDREERELRHQAMAAARPITAELAVSVLSGVLDDSAIVMEEATTNEGVVREHLDRELPGTIFAIGAAGLGWVMGAALGVKLGRPAADVVGVCGDGSFMFSAPVAALWAAKAAQAPFVTMILNNGGYRASKNPVVSLFPDGESVRTGDFTGTVLDPAPQYAEIARACDAHGERVTEPGELDGALRRALEATRSGRCAVVDVALARI